MNIDNIAFYNADCMAVMKSMPDNSVDMTLTDIPYGEVNRGSHGLRTLDKENADITTFSLNDFLSEVYRVTAGTSIVFCGREQFSEIFSFYASKGGTTRPIVWEKTNPSPMNGQHIYLSGVEFAVWHKKRGCGHFNAFCKNTVFRFPNGRRKFHPTEKNLDLISELLLDNTVEGETVFDPCAGSATTGIACIKNNRKFVGVEMDSGYYEIAKTRLEQVYAEAVGQ